MLLLKAPTALLTKPHLNLMHGAIVKPVPYAVPAAHDMCRSVK
jgi:hypothetical protein